MFYSLLYIFPIFRAICEYHALLLRTILRTIFSHLRTKQSAAQQVSGPSMETSGNQKEQSPVSRMG